MTHHPFAKTIAVAVAAVVLTAGTVAAVGTSPFSDTSGHEHEAEIVLANSKGLFQGYGDKTFRPDQTLTNRQSEVVLGRLLDRYTDDNGNSTLTRAEAAVVLTRGVCGLDGDCEAAQPGPVARVNEDGEGTGPGAGPGEDEPEPPTVTEPPEPPTVTLPPVAAIPKPCGWTTLSVHNRPHWHRDSELGGVVFDGHVYYRHHAGFAAEGEGYWCIQEIAHIGRLHYTKTDIAPSVESWVSYSVRCGRAVSDDWGTYKYANRPANTPTVSFNTDPNKRKSSWLRHHRLYSNAHGRTLDWAGAAIFREAMKAAHQNGTLADGLPDVVQRWMGTPEDLGEACLAVPDSQMRRYDWGDLR